MDVPLEKLTRWKVIPELVVRAMMAGDSGPRYKMIRAMAGYQQKDEVLDEYFDKHPETLSHEEHVKAYKQLAESFGVKGVQDDTNLTCGNCGLVCGPSVEESIKRYKLVTQSGLVVRTADGTMKRVDTFEEAVKMRQIPKRTTWQRITGALSLLWVFHKWYFGFEPKSFIQGIIYDRKLKKAVKDRIRGHKQFLGTAAPTSVNSSAAD